MKYFKMLGLLAIAAAALMAFVGTASATLTSPAGTKYGGEIFASSTNSELDGAIDVKCKSSTVKGTPSGAGATSGSISVLTFANCGADTVTVLNKGSLSVASNGVVTSTGAEVTVQLHRTIFVIYPITTHCIYKTNNTNVGTLTEGGNPVLHIGSSPIPQVATDSACGDNAVWTGDYTVNTPGSLVVD